MSEPKPNSREVVEAFGKEHKNVLRDIQRLECSAQFTALNFEASAILRRRNIEKLDCSDNFRKLNFEPTVIREKVGMTEQFNRLNFQPSEYLNEQGRTQPCVDMTRDGLTFLVMGFTGATAALAALVGTCLDKAEVHAYGNSKIAPQ